MSSVIESKEVAFMVPDVNIGEVVVLPSHSVDVWSNVVYMDYRCGLNASTLTVIHAGKMLEVNYAQALSLAYIRDMVITNLRLVSDFFDLDCTYRAKVKASIMEQIREPIDGVFCRYVDYSDYLDFEVTGDAEHKVIMEIVDPPTDVFVLIDVDNMADLFLGLGPLDPGVQVLAAGQANVVNPHYDQVVPVLEGKDASDAALLELLMKGLSESKGERVSIILASNDAGLRTHVNYLANAVSCGRSVLRDRALVKVELVRTVGDINSKVDRVLNGKHRFRLE
jgi:hypothetical protein